jgi:hypothetical protein
MRASILVRRADTLFWAARATNAAGTSEIVVLRKQGRRWSPEVISTLDASDLALSYSDSLGAVLAVVQPDTTKREDNGSIFFYSRRPTWKLLRRVVSGEKDAGYAPALFFNSTRGVLSWTALVGGASGERASRTLTTDLWGWPINTFVVDPGIVESSVPIEIIAGVPLWITDHVLVGSSERELRFVSGSDSIGSIAGAIPNPYTGYFGAVSLGHGEVLVAGPLIDHTKRRVLSLLIRAKLECDVRK